ncbi:MAG: hypothetical protein DRJ01_19015, partial [Bacteroidetes bacterium]
MNIFKLINIIIIVIIFSNVLSAQQSQDTIGSPINDSTSISQEEILNEKKPVVCENIDTAGQFNLLIKDSQVLVTLDSLLFVKFYKRDFFNIDTSGISTKSFAAGSVPKYPDSIYAQRIEALNIETPIELTYNKEVKSFINLYAVKKKDLTARMLGLAEIYFPFFEEILDKYDIPLEIKHLAIVESALNPAAGSHAGAKGLWQFMYGTGKVYGLKVTSLVDD